MNAIITHNTHTTYDSVADEFSLALMQQELISNFMLFSSGKLPNNSTGCTLSPCFSTFGAPGSYR